MSWKAWSPSDKFGTVCAIIGFLLGYLFLISLSSASLMPGFGGGGGPSPGTFLWGFVFSIPFAIAFYAIGAFIGWIYGKIRGK